MIRYQFFKVKSSSRRYDLRSYPQFRKNRRQSWHLLVESLRRKVSANWPMAIGQDDCRLFEILVEHSV